LRIQNEQLSSADWHANQVTSTLVSRVAAHWHRALRSGAVDWKSTERGSAPREEALAGRNVAIPIRFCEPQTDTIRPHEGMHRFVVGVLPQHARKTGARTKKARRDSQVQGFVAALVRVQRLVTGVVDQRS